jgi:uncharacterized protein (TIGR03435 family)
MFDEYRPTDSAGELVCVFYPSPVRPPEAISQTISLIRGLGLYRLVSVSGSKSVVMRAPENQIKTAEWLLLQLEKTVPGRAEYRTADGAAGILYAPQPPGTTHDELLPAIRQVTDNLFLVRSHNPEAIIVRGSSSVIDVSAWLLHALNEPASERRFVTHEFKLDPARNGPGAEDEIVGVFYAPAETEAALRELAGAVHLATRVVRIAVCPGAGAFVIRGTAAQIALAEDMLKGKAAPETPAGATAPKTFDVASVKPSPTDTNLSSQRRPDGLDSRGQTLKSYLARAYSLGGYQFGGPGWMDAERYDISARASGPVSEQQLRIMLQALLQERFHLSTHREKQMLQWYALVVEKGGLKIHPVPLEKGAAPARQPSTSRRHMAGKGGSIQNLVRNLEGLLGCPVEDATHVEGVFDFDLTWTPDAVQLAASRNSSALPTPADVSGPSLFDVLADQLGLKLEKRKIAVDVLVVDHGDKVPSAN